jgi:glutathione synthase/RimK-type ligase-like ATP-grasp enzyme
MAPSPANVGRKLLWARTAAELVLDSQVVDLSGVRATATTVQRWVPKSHEVRLTIIDDASFPIAIHADSDAAYLDWRSDLNNVRYELVTVPDDVLAAARELMRRMRLSYAGFDFVVEPEGRWVMLEANTGPQFGWLESATGAPMVSAMADLLVKGVR